MFSTSANSITTGAERMTPNDYFECNTSGTVTDTGTETEPLVPPDSRFQLRRGCHQRLTASI
jgi:hypothetical protein